MTDRQSAVPIPVRVPEVRRPSPNLSLPGAGSCWLGTVGWLSFQDVGIGNQLALAATAVVGLILMRLCRLSNLFRWFFVAATFMTLRYTAWRITDTLPDLDTLSFVPGILLFLAEMCGIAMYFFGVFVNIQPIDRIYSTAETREGLKVLDQAPNRFGS